MSLQPEYNRRWRRKHDHPKSDWKAPEIVYPESLEELLVLCGARGEDRRLKASGSRWALSESARSDYTFIETSDPDNKRAPMSKTLTGVVPRCLHPGLLARMQDASFPQDHGTVIHVEAGKRIYDLYAELDEPDTLEDENTLGGYLAIHHGLKHFTGPWGLETAGNAGGQTIVGALSTGTHGGDFDRGPIADSVVAMHLVVDGGHLWVERKDRERFAPQLTDDDRLTTLYGSIDLSHTDPTISADRRFPEFRVVRDDDIFDALLVSAGRFGVIYSVVLAAVPQYSLWERRRRMIWQEIRSMVGDRGSLLYNDSAERPGTPKVPQAERQQFLMIAICLTQHGDAMNLCGVTKRWSIPVEVAPEGRSQRVGERIDQPPIPKRWRLAGNSAPYSAATAAIPAIGSWVLPPDPFAAGNPSALDLACADPSFLRGLIKQVCQELEDFVTSDGTFVGATFLAVAVQGAAGLPALIPQFALALKILEELLDALDADDRLGEWLDLIMKSLLDPDLPEPLRAATHFTWQMIAYLVFSQQQSDTDFGARSYAVNDRKNYLDKSCESGNVDSIEVFFDPIADFDRMTTYIDALIAYNRSMELRGKSTLGYVSLRFTGPTRALLGMQRWSTTCSIEVAAVKDLTGSTELVEYASALAIHPTIRGILHWGQRNDCTEKDIELRFGDLSPHATGNLREWRKALVAVTGDGRIDRFSNRFTRQTGLEP